MFLSSLTIHKFKEKEIGRGTLRRWKEIQGPERKQKEWAVEEQRKSKKRLKR